MTSPPLYGVPRHGLVWTAGLVVAAAAAIATAHGLYEVARAAGTPTPIAALYPLITDGLALVAYATTTRLDPRGRRYAWTIVVLAAGLSGLAQAAFLAGGVHAVPAWLRFGIGAWPATAAAIVAHLLYLLAAAVQPGNVQPARPSALDAHPDQPSNARLDGLDGAVAAGIASPDLDRYSYAGAEADSGPGDRLSWATGTVRPASNARPTRLDAAELDAVQLDGQPPTLDDTVLRRAENVAPSAAVVPAMGESASTSDAAAAGLNGTAKVRDDAAAALAGADQPDSAAEPPRASGKPEHVSSSARERARAAARAHRDNHGAWPTVNVLAEIADVARGTAATALKELRSERPTLHVLHQKQPRSDR